MPNESYWRGCLPPRTTSHTACVVRHKAPSPHVMTYWNTHTHKSWSNEGSVANLLKLLLDWCCLCITVIYRSIFGGVFSIFIGLLCVSYCSCRCSCSCSVVIYIVAFHLLTCDMYKVYKPYEMHRHTHPRIHIHTVLYFLRTYNKRQLLIKWNNTTSSVK